MKIIELFKKKSVSLSFSIVSGLAYFLIITKFILEKSSANGLLSFFFFPAITFGIALLLIKIINSMIESENQKGLMFVVACHITVIILSILMMVEGLIR